jgi:hypothetical protein
MLSVPCSTKGVKSGLLPSPVSGLPSLLKDSRLYSTSSLVNSPQPTVHGRTAYRICARSCLIDKAVLSQVTGRFSVCFLFRIAPKALNSDCFRLRSPVFRLYLKTPVSTPVYSDQQMSPPSPQKKSVPQNGDYGQNSQRSPGVCQQRGSHNH